MSAERGPVFVHWLAGMIFFMATAQVMFKLAGNHAAAQSDPAQIFMNNAWLWAGLVSSAVGMVCWLLTLHKMPLSRAYPWTAMIYVITPLASAVIFDDVLTGQYLLGMACIVLGVYITASGEGA